MNSWFETHKGIWTHVWGTLAEGVADPTHPARLQTLATVGTDGWPQARTVVLRSAEPCFLTVHTDRFSDKIQSLNATPRAALHIWDPAQNLQIRLQAEVTIQTGDDVADIWHSVPDHARQSYGVTPPPGRPIPNALAYVKDPDPDTFAVLLCQITHIDAVHLGDQHRRAAFSRLDDWAGQWLSP